jgi:hypothetical protein
VTKTLHATTFDYLKPTDKQMDLMAQMREASKNYAEFLDAHLPAGPDKTYILRRVRETAMWVNVTVTRESDGTPRPDHDHAG